MPEITKKRNNDHLKYLSGSFIRTLETELETMKAMEELQIIVNKRKMLNIFDRVNSIFSDKNVIRTSEIWQIRLERLRMAIILRARVFFRNL